MHVLGYVIVATRDDGTRWYMAIDLASGGYEYFTQTAASAEVHREEAHAAAALSGRMMRDTVLHAASAVRLMKQVGGRG